MLASLSVTVVILKKDCVLLTLRGDFPVWCLPGGGVEVKESIDQAAVREVREETGLVVRLSRLVGIYFTPKEPAGIHTALLTADVIGGEAMPDSIETVKVEWFPLAHLPDTLLGFHRLFIHDALQNVPAVLKTMNILPSFPQLSHEAINNMIDQRKLNNTEIQAELYGDVDNSNIQNGLG